MESFSLVVLLTLNRLVRPFPWSNCTTKPAPGAIQTVGRLERTRHLIGYSEKHQITIVMARIQHSEGGSSSRGQCTGSFLCGWPVPTGDCRSISRTAASEGVGCKAAPHF